MKNFSKGLSLFLIFGLLFNFGLGSVFAYSHDDSEKSDRLEVTKERVEKKIINVRGETKTETDERKEDLQEKREEKKETVEQKREEAKERATEKLEERKLEIKEKLDQRLQERMEKLVDMLNAKNDHLTSVYLKHLERIEEILDKVLTRADKALEPDQYDALVVLAEALRVEIDVTVDLVLSQKEKVYTISAETKEEFGEAFRTVMGEFKDDHQIIRTSLRGVRDELHDFFEEVKEAIKAATPADREEQEEENEGV